MGRSARKGILGGAASGEGGNWAEEEEGGEVDSTVAGSVRRVLDVLRGTAVMLRLGLRQEIGGRPHRVVNRGWRET